VKYETLDVTITDAVMTVVLNRPEKKNAMGPTTLSELHSVLDDNDRSKDVRVLILTGSGDSFTAGADIKTLAVNRADDPTLYYQEYKYMLSLQEKLRLFPKATIAAVNGWCLGWGMWIVSVCDFAIASKKSQAWSSAGWHGSYAVRRRYQRKPGSPASPGRAVLLAYR